MASVRGQRVVPIGARSGATPYLFSEKAQDQLADALSGFSEPDEVLRRAGIPRTALRKLEADDEISSALDTRQEACIASAWRIEADATGGPQAEGVSDRIYRELEPHIETLLRGGWDALPYGYAVCELTYEQRESGEIGIANVSPKPFDWFEPRTDGRLFYRPQTGELEEIPWRVNLAHSLPELRVPKFLLVRRNPTYLQPQGRALLSRLYWPWYMRTQGWKYWARFLERHASPLLLGKVAAKTGEADKDFEARLDAMLQALLDAQNNAVLATGIDDAVDSIGSGSAGDAYDRFEVAVNKRVQKVILGQTLTSDVTKTGSYAASKTHNLVREDRRLADIRMLTSPMQHIVDALTLLNFGPNVPSPTFKLEPERGMQVERAERDSLLMGRGLPLTRTYFLRHYGFEEDELDEKFAAPSETAASSMPKGPGGAANTGGDAQLADDLGTDAGVERTVRAQQGALDTLIARTSARAPQPLDAKEVLAAIRAAKHPEDLAERLLAMVPRELEDDDELRTLIERAMFAADVMGYAHADEQVE